LVFYISENGGFKGIMAKLLMLIGFLGHVICGITDCMMAYSKSGKFDFSMAKEPEKMKKVFSTMPLKQLEMAMLLGVAALFMASFGYIGLAEHMEVYSPIASKVMLFSAMFFLIPIAAHHVLCGTTEWYYVKLGRTEEALQVVMDFFKKTVVVSVAYVGLLIFVITLFVLVVTGATDLPRWACVFNTLTAFIVLSPTKIPAKGNIANAFMFLGMMIVI
jgi:hypothetical protein